MSRLRTALKRYVGMRQGLGYKYDGPARRLSAFVTFMEARGADTITTDLAMEWVTLMGRQPSWSIRLPDVRCFAQHLTHFDPLTVVPPSDAVPPARRAKPYIYSEIEIQALLAAALSLPPAGPSTLDISLPVRTDSGGRTAPFRSARPAPGRRRSRPGRPHYPRDKVRQVTAGPAACHDNRCPFRLCRPTRCAPWYAAQSLFLRRRTGRQIAASIRAPRVLATIPANRITAEGNRDGPRIHDLRHRLAVQTLINWHRAGEDVARELPVLSTFLGHANVRDTYWYLFAAPELMNHAVRRLDRRWEVGQ